MAKHQKTTPHLPITINVPTSLAPVMQAFHATSEQTVKELIIDAARAVYGVNRDYVISNIELKGIIALMRNIAPNGTIETLYAAQIVVSYMLGMRRLAEGYSEDAKLGMKLLKFSNEAIHRLGRKRSGGPQNITVNYNHKVA